MKADVLREAAKELRCSRPGSAELCERLADKVEQQELAKRLRRLEEERGEQQGQCRGIEVSR